MKLFKKNEGKKTEKLPMSGKVRKGFRFYCTAVMALTLVVGTSVTAFAANDPIAVVNNLSDFIFGLSLRQFIFSVLACGVAVGLYFLLRPYFGTETLSWVCILGAAPFALMGFVKYNGMNAEQFVWAWIKSDFLMPKMLVFHPDNLYYETLKATIQNHEKEALKNNA